MRTNIMAAFLLAAPCWAVVGCSTTESSPEQAATVPPSFSYDATAIAGPKPWTDKEFGGREEEFQFAVIGDRTGGANVQGTFALAMGQLNLLNPEFVINVGDIIEGYAETEAELTEMWEEAEALVGTLDMPFFFTRGNHDVSFPGGKDMWATRRGPAYYSFVYENVLFLVLDSEDAPRPEPPQDIMNKIKLYNELQVEDPDKAREMLADFMADEAIVAALGQPVEFPETQLAWIERTLADHPDVRWTFLFMHEPCWENPSPSFERIGDLLQARDYTFIAGHLHYYDYDQLDGRDHITMGPAGASWHHDGEGNVDHIMWVTMTDEGPEIGNIALKGVFDRRGLDSTLFGAYDRKGAD